MIVIVDTNIVFSAILNINGTIAKLILKYDDVLDFKTSSYLKYEIEKHKFKLKKISGLADDKLNISINLIFDKINFVEDKEIALKNRHKGYELSKGIDENDFLFISLNECFDNSFLWTGDKKLRYGLRNKGYNKVIETSELLDYAKTIKNNK